LVEGGAGWVKKLRGKREISGALAGINGRTGNRLQEEKSQGKKNTNKPGGEKRVEEPSLRKNEKRRTPLQGMLNQRIGRKDFTEEGVLEKGW